MPAKHGKHSRRRRRRSARPRFFGFLLLLVLMVGLIWGAVRLVGSNSLKPAATPVPTLEPTVVPTEPPEPTAAPTPTPEPTPVPTPTVTPVFSPSSVSGTDPSDWKFTSDVSVDGAGAKGYERTGDEEIYFDTGENYTDLEGVITFRGNNFRDSAAYGTVSLTEYRFAASPWQFKVGALKKVYNSGAGGDYWTGCGWTGQPLIVRWPEETKKIMNLYEGAKNNPDLVEVIYATMDGNIYFLDLETGEPTRDPIRTTYPFKGAGALDPRGYPLLYVGAGDDSPKDGALSARAFVFSLIDGSILYQFGSQDNFAQRAFYTFDSSALVDAETDTLLYPGEDGVLYTMKLNTKYDAQAGTIQIKPSPVVKWRYKGKRSATTGVNGKKAFWLGMEDSMVTWQGYAFFADNGGMLMCLNLNTMRVVWIQDTLDDTNCTPVLDIEDGHPYLYISTSYHIGWRTSGASAEIPVWKIDALTGEVVWSHSYQCGTVSGVSGGVQGTLAMGKNALSEYVYVPVAMTNGAHGLLVALRKSDGSEAWRHEFAGYPWSSPVAIYDNDGNGWLIQCNMSGYIHLLDGLTGEVLDEMDLGSNVEASPAVYNNKVVVGTRGGTIYGVTIE